MRLLYILNAKFTLWNIFNKIKVYQSLSIQYDVNHYKTQFEIAWEVNHI